MNIYGCNIEGNRRLNGSVKVAGYKHSTVMLLNGAILCRGISVLHNVPDITDIKTYSILSNTLGYKIEKDEDLLFIDASSLSKADISPELSQTIHGTVYLWPVLLARTGIVKMFPTGGCKFENRSSTHISDVLQQMGAKVIDKGDHFELVAEKGLIGTEFDFSKTPANKHSGCTKTAILASIYAEGRTHILNPFQAQEIEDLCSFLRMAGASIEFQENEIMIDGSKSLLKGVEYTLPGDFLEWATLTGAVLSAGGNIFIESSIPVKYFQPEIDLLRKVGANFSFSSNGSTICSSTPLKSANFQCPPIYSDLQPIMTAILCLAHGESWIEDLVWPDRTDHLEGLRLLGGDARQIDEKIFVKGPSFLKGNDLFAKNLRSAAALLIAAIGAEGRSTLIGIDHLTRGYSNLIEKLVKLGAKIEEFES